MTKSNLPFIDNTVNKSIDWIKDVTNELGWVDTRKGYLALRAVLHALRDRLTIEEAVGLGAQMPLLIRGIYFEGWILSRSPVKIRKKEEFLFMVTNNFPEMEDPEKMVAAVFNVLSRRISLGEVTDIRSTLPKQINELWP